MSKNLVPIELPLITQTPQSPINGFAKVYLRQGYTKVLHATGPEKDLVLDRPLSNFTSTGPAIIVTDNDTVLTGIQKLQQSLLKLKLNGFLTGTATYTGGFLMIESELEPLDLNPTPFNVFYDPLTNEMTYAQATTGPQGIQGIQGTQGVQGQQGTTGIQGSQGLQGIQGVQGTVGNTGSQGAIGSTGAQGTTGMQGITGDTGAQGAIGSTGSQGITGTQGVEGLQGFQGSQGIQGTQGLEGLQGVQGLQGIQGTQGIQGIEGLQGIQGIQGLQGTQGTEGLQGVTGSQGLQGVQGVQGLYGQWYFSDTEPTSYFEGMVWYNTATGKRYLRFDGYWIQDGDVYTSTGPQGPVGIQGVTGTTGAQGTTGLTGSQGVQGTQGPSAGGGDTYGTHIIVKPQPSVYYSTNPFSGSGTTLSTTANFYYLAPFIPKNTISVNEFRIDIITTAVGGLATIILFDDLNGLPKNKLLESTNLDCSTSGIKTFTANYTFNAGTVYWIGVSVNATIGIRANNTSFVLQHHASSSAMNLQYVKAASFGSVPSSVTISPNSDASSLPAATIRFRAV
jgi:hypothetical protein